MDTLNEAFERASTGQTDVVLVESSYVRSCLTSDDGRELLERAAKKTAIVVLQHEDDSAADAQCMVEAVRLGVVDVIRYPLVKQNTANLWQHSVRKMMTDKSNPVMLETLKRSASEPDMRFSMPYRHARRARGAARRAAATFDHATGTGDERGCHEPTPGTIIGANGGAKVERKECECGQGGGGEKVKDVFGDRQQVEQGQQGWHISGQRA
jgi:hypothetical protein